MTVEPALKFVITKSSIDSAKVSSAAASTAGAISGSVTRKNVCRPFAPRSCAASSRMRSKPISRERTVTTTNDDAEHHVRDQDRREAAREARPR